MKFVELTEKEYQDFLNNYDGKTFLQSVEMSKVNKKIGNEIFYLGVKDKNEVIAASLFIVRYNKKRKYFYSPRGLQLDYNNFDLLCFYVEKLKDFIKKKNGYMLKIDPYIELYSRNNDGEKTDELNNLHILKSLEKLGFKYLNYSVQKKWLYILDLNNKKTDEVFNNFKSNVKNIIRKCQRIGIEIEELDNDLKRFSEIVSETAERKNFSVRDDEYYSFMKEEFKENLKIYIAKINLQEYLKILTKELKELEEGLPKIKGEGKRKNHEENIENIKNNINKIKQIKKEYGEVIDLAASMFCVYGNEVIYLFSGSKEEFLFLNAPYLIQWYIIEKTINMGIPLYNFYGIEDLSDPNIKTRGVYDFKKGFNGKVVETIGEMDLYINLLDKFKYYVKKLFKKI